MPERCDRERSPESIQKQETAEEHEERNPEVNVSHNGAEQALFSRIFGGHPRLGIVGLDRG
jgi:hypothetical protein